MSYMSQSWGTKGRGETEEAQGRCKWAVFVLMILKLLTFRFNKTKTS